MSLSQKIAAALDARSELSASPCDVAVEDAPNRLTLRVTASGPIGLAFDLLEFETSVRPEWTPEQLGAWGERLAARITYLMEPLVVLEHDKRGGEVELRSHAPTSRGDRRSYFEIRLNRQGTLRLSRIAYDEVARRRHPASCQMTREVLDRLVDDLVASVA
jgi:hypothetical protein